MLINSLLSTKKLPHFDVVIDWLEFTIKTMSLPDLCNCLGINFKDLVRFNSGLFGYDITFVYREKIKFLLNSKDYDISNYSIKDNIKKENGMGIHVLLSGYACREIEQELEWYKLLDFVYYESSKISRIDIAFDVFNSQLIDLKKVLWYTKRGLLVAKHKKALNTEELVIDTGKIKGHSLKIGSSSSETMVMIYDKYQERDSANYVVDKKIKKWTRIELRLRNKTARQFLSAIFNQQLEIPYTALEVINNLISFKDLKVRQTDTNRSRWINAPWWNELIGECRKLKLSNKAIQSTIQRKQKWIEKSVEQTLASVFVSCIDDITPDNAIEFIKNGIDKISNMSLNQINEYRLQQKASILDQHDLDLIKYQLSKYTEK